MASGKGNDPFLEFTRQMKLLNGYLAKGAVFVFGDVRFVVTVAFGFVVVDYAVAVVFLLFSRVKGGFIVAVQ